MPLYKNETGNVIVESVENRSGSTKTFRFDPGEQKETEFVLLNNNLTEVSAAPYFNPLMRVQVVTSTGSSDPKTININRETKKIVIYNSSDSYVTCFLRATANIPGLPIPSNTLREISIGCNVDQIICQFSESGTITIEERK